MTTDKLLFTLALALAVWPGHATAQDVSGYDRFKLFNECRPINLVIEEYPGDTDWSDTGLTVDRIHTMVESRLRAARLYDGAAPTHLYVNVNVVSVSFSQRVSYNKLVYEPVSDESYYAVT